ncbi:MAG: hypothetical protein IPM84_25675 [Anaerolineae bacterium]|nr:hypothetical protein [Anaerolineae bacterium]
MSRRSIVAFLVTVLMVAVVGVVPAGAHVSWCSSDPVVTLPDGSVVNVVVEAPVENTGSTVSVNLLAPQGSVLTAVLAGDLDLDVNFHAVQHANRMFLVVAPHGNFPLRVTVTRDGATVAYAEGESGHALTMWVNF